ncbi:TorD/DmsD family molecular chaperone [Vibrio breoganii]|uniref:TorD/DmsD family molecular chaperone n=1 Tax=Vibrio breoganii TaxID=553239 RepID=UPI0021C3CB31|nr:molecular chaperone TorD family protein [Vibrio breoganii]MDN3714747.1 molecular chaperone TorD family protein [Vibrio breoganii]
MNQEALQAPRADIYLLLATLFRQPPNSDLLKWLAEIETEDSNSQMSADWQALKQAASQATQQELEEEYQDLFIGVGRGEVMPFASWHLSGALMEKPLIALRQDLTALGFERNDSVKEPEDHIAAICEVMAMLVEENSPQQGVFFNRHIGTWYKDLVKQIQSANAAGFYVVVASLLASFLELEAVALSEQSIAVRSSELD